MGVQTGSGVLGKVGAGADNRYVGRRKQRDRKVILVRSRLVARDLQGGGIGRDDLFADTPPLEAKRMLLSRAATRRRDGRMRKLLLIDAKKAH